MAKQYAVKLMSRAARDLDSIYGYIAGTLLEPGTAQKVAEELEREILSLAQFPNRCPLRRSGVYANKGYRQLLVKNYAVIYRVDEETNTVVVVTVRYAANQF